MENSLTAQELLKNKGIKSETWKKWDKTSDMLPSKGEKRYEPNKSWLQNKQIEDGLKNRRDILAVERVERSSQLAAAEWLPNELRARVTKKSGQEWTSFGLEENLELYLIPEEVLLLMELNCLELTWEGVAVSIQQAYQILLGSDQNRCTIDEYRVYSHLVRQGYRLQRFHSEDLHGSNDKNNRSSMLKRKKLIYDPVDGFGMNRDRISAAEPTVAKKNCSNITTGVLEESASRQKAGSSVDRTENVSEDSNHDDKNASIIGRKEASAKKLLSEVYDNGAVNLPGPSNMGSKKTGNESKLQIISDEKLSGDFRIISNWPGIRVQRNVKLMPKRNADGTIPLIVKRITNGSDRIQSPSSVAASSLSDTPKTQIKKRTHEVIEVSDDEIEEVPLKMSRAEMLDLFPNIMSEKFNPKKISRRYLPHNIWPQKISNRYTKRRTTTEDKRRISSDGNKTFYQRSRDHTQAPTWLAESRSGFSGEHQRISVQMGVFTSVAVDRNIFERPNLLRRGFSHQYQHHQQNLWTNISYFHSRHNLINFSPQSVWDRTQYGYFARDSSNIPYRRPLLNDPRRISDASRYLYSFNHPQSPRMETDKPSFKVVPGAKSWVETKAKWMDEKTITIEDEDCVEDSEVKVVAKPVKPLASRQNATTFAQVYKNLQFIKSATSSKNSRSYRKAKKIEYYKISYNLYTSGRRFKKTNPGTPAYRIVVFRSEDTPFIELADILRLEKDSKEIPILMACGSQQSITFAEMGSVRLPNINDNYIER